MAERILKSVERRIRRRILSALEDPVADWPTDMRVYSDLPDAPRILVVRNDRLGDALVTTPLLRALRVRFPDSRIDILLGEKNAVVGPLLPYLNNRIVMGGLADVSTVSRLRKTGYDLVLNTRLVKSASTTLVCRAVGGGLVLEYPYHDPWTDYPPDACHVVAMQHRLLSPLGVAPILDSDAAENPLAVQIADEPRERADAVWNELTGAQSLGTRVLVNMSAGNLLSRPSVERLGLRQLDDVRAAELAVLLRSEGLTPVFCAAPPDREILNRVSSLAEGAALILPRDESLADFAALIDGATVVVSPDTSVVHLAVALGKPTVALFRSADWARFWRPWGVRHRVIAHDEGVGSIPVAAIHNAVRELLTDNI